jgi:hypothetical protein
MMTRESSSPTSDWIARLTWQGAQGAVVLGNDLQWRIEDTPAEDQSFLEMQLAGARLHSEGYSYSTSDGQPGYLLAHRVAKTLQAKIETRPVPPGEPGTMY